MGTRVGPVLVEAQEWMRFLKNERARGMSRFTLEEKEIDRLIQAWDQSGLQELAGLQARLDQIEQAMQGYQGGAARPTQQPGPAGLVLDGSIRRMLDEARVAARREGGAQILAGLQGLADERRGQPGGSELELAVQSLKRAYDV